MHLPQVASAVIACGVVAAATQSPSGPDVLDSLPPLHGEAAAYDQARGRLVVFGGRTPSDWLQGTWEWDGHRWRRTVAADAGPSARGGHVMAYDAVRQRIVLFGGAQGPRLLCDTWILERGTWTQTTEASCITDRVRNAGLAADARGGRLLLVDGPAIGDDEGRPARVWQRSGDTWSLVTQDGPRRIGFSAVAYDAARGVLVAPVLFGGPDTGTWEWDGKTWRRADGSLPSPRQTYGLTYDTARRRVVLAGGQGSRQGPYFDDLWSWDGTRWLAVEQPGERPAPRGGGSLLTDARRARLLYFGGYNSGVLGDLWSFERGVWRRLSTPKVTQATGGRVSQR